MAVANTTTMKFEGTDWESLEFEGQHKRLQIESADAQGDVEIELEDYNESHYFYLNQEDLKKLITHLQKQVK